jgi:DNA ligase-associated metallophosphoesterase
MEISKGVLSTVVAGASLWLHPYRAAFWAEEQTLLLADLHLGKVAHFRQEGIAVPTDASNENWDRLISLLLEFRPQRVLFLGDLFHSHYNQEWDEFCELIAQFEDTSFELVLGNHDILPPALYDHARLVVHQEPYLHFPFCFSHHPLKAVPSDYYNLAGHIHPCVYLSGARGQRTRLPCFYFAEKGGIFPAFGAFTGMSGVKAGKNDRVFVIAGEEVLEV